MNSRGQIVQEWTIRAFENPCLHSYAEIMWAMLKRSAIELVSRISGVSVSGKLEDKILGKVQTLVHVKKA